MSYCFDLLAYENVVVVASGRPSRAESGRLGKLGSVLLGSARFGIFVEYRAEPYNNHFQIIFPTSLTRL